MERKKQLYTYVLRVDDGAAPNPFYDVCTLAICKPGIRATARIGDWIIGTGSKNSQLAKKEFHDLSTYVVYAMKVTDRMNMEQYNKYCEQSLRGKIPNRKSQKFEKRMGDSIYYDFISPQHAEMRESVHSDHKDMNTRRDLKGKNVLLSTHFYYFGLAAKELPPSLRSIIKKNQGHKITDDEKTVAEFEEWISQFNVNKLYAMPQLSWQNTDNSSHCNVGCSPTDAAGGVC